MQTVSLNFSRLVLLLMCLVVVKADVMEEIGEMTGITDFFDQDYCAEKQTCASCVGAGCVFYKGNSIHHDGHDAVNVHPSTVPTSIIVQESASTMEHCSQPENILCPRNLSCVECVELGCMFMETMNKVSAGHYHCMSRQEPTPMNILMIRVVEDARECISHDDTPTSTTVNSVHQTDGLDKVIDEVGNMTGMSDLFDTEDVCQQYTECSSCVNGGCIFYTGTPIAATDQSFECAHEGRMPKHIIIRESAISLQQCLDPHEIICVINATCEECVQVGCVFKATFKKFSELPSLCLSRWEPIPRNNMVITEYEDLPSCVDYHQLQEWMAGNASEPVRPDHSLGGGSIILYASLGLSGSIALVLVLILGWRFMQKRKRQTWRRLGLPTYRETVEMSNLLEEESRADRERDLEMFHILSGEYDKDGQPRSNVRVRAKDEPQPCSSFSVKCVGAEMEEVKL